MTKPASTSKTARKQYTPESRDEALKPDHEKSLAKADDQEQTVGKIFFCGCIWTLCPDMDD